MVSEHDVESLVPGNFFKCHRDRSCNILIDNDVQAAHIGNQPEEVSKIRLLEVEIDEFPVKHLRFCRTGDCRSLYLRRNADA